MRDAELVTISGLDARWLSPSVVQVVREDQLEVCARSGACWTVPDDATVAQAMVTETERLFAMLRIGDDDVLWYSR